MSDEPRAVPTHSAAWHYEEAERCLSLSSFFSNKFGSVDGMQGVHLINPKVQEHFVAMAQVHATLALAGATILGIDPHSRARTDLASHARGAGTRET